MMFCWLCDITSRSQKGTEQWRMKCCKWFGFETSYLHTFSVRCTHNAENTWFGHYYGSLRCPSWWSNITGRDMLSFEKAVKTKEDYGFWWCVLSAIAIMEYRLSARKLNTCQSERKRLLSTTRPQTLCRKGDYFSISYKNTRLNYQLKLLESSWEW